MYAIRIYLLDAKLINPEKSKFKVMVELNDRSHLVDQESNQESNLIDP